LEVIVLSKDEDSSNNVLDSIRFPFASPKYGLRRRAELLKFRWANVDCDLNTITFRKKRKVAPYRWTDLAAKCPRIAGKGGHCRVRLVDTPERGITMSGNPFPQPVTRQASRISGFTIYIIGSAVG
jgi:hypothetical protein